MILPHDAGHVKGELIAMKEHEKEQARRAVCCHESGHAVARVLLGDSVLLMVSDPAAEMTEVQKALYHSGHRITDERGNTMARCKERTCRCGRPTIRNRSNPIASEFCVSLECEGCLDVLVGELASRFAGAAATLQLMPNGHNDADAMFDMRVILQIVESLELVGQKREAIIKQAIARAHNWIQQESRAVLALADALFNAVVLDGEEAERIVRANLSQAIPSPRAG
jgi:hypothetical protein